MNKTAREMFEALGYAMIENNDDGIAYAKGDSRIIFYKIDNLKSVSAINLDVMFGDLEHCITMDELKAINKQCEELGWLDE